MTVLFVVGTSIAGLAVARHSPEFRSHIQLMATFTKVQRAPVARLEPASPPTPPASTVPTVDPASAVAVAKSFSTDERLIESRVRAYAQKAIGVGVAEAVRKPLRPRYSDGEMRSRIDASSPLDTTLIDIVVHDTDRTRAVAVGSAVAAELINQANEEKLPAGEDVSFKIQLVVSQAMSAPASPVARPLLRYVVSGTIGVLAIGIGLATLRALLRRRRQTVLDWVENGWHVQVARIRSFARLANERFWGPGWR